jgi:hypothetical protein
VNEFDEAFGVYVGSASYEDVVAVLTNTPPGSQLLVRIDNREAPKPEEELTLKFGYPQHFSAEDEAGRRRFVLVLADHEQALGYDVKDQDDPFVLEISDHPRLDADRYSGGVRVRSPSSTVFDIAVWQPTQHGTESGSRRRI